MYLYSSKLTCSIAGPIVRISPSEIHINGSDSFQNVVRREESWDKYSWIVDASDESDTAIFTAGHDQHSS